MSNEPQPTPTEKRVAILLQEPPNEDDANAIGAGLTAFNRQHMGSPRFDAWAIFLRDAQGRVRGGIHGILYTEVAMIQLLWVEAGLRGQGYGRALLRCAEAHAARHGATFVFAEIMGFQSPEFFVRCGYSSFGGVDGFRGGVVRDSVGRAVTPNAPPCDQVSAPLVISAEAAPGKQDVALLRAGVAAAALDAGWPDDERRLVLVARAEEGRLAGKVVGGVVGESRWGGCHVDILWVHEALRSGGLGTRLLRAAEAEAQARSCSVIFLETMQFQARPFYEKLGYSLDWTMQAARGELTVFGLSKRLPAQAEGTP